MSKDTTQANQPQRPVTVEEFNQHVKQLHAIAMSLGELENNKIATPQREMDASNFRQALVDFIINPANAVQVLEGYLASQFEYVPLVRALAPIVAQCNQAIFQAQQIRKAHAVAAAKAQEKSNIVTPAFGTKPAQVEASAPTPSNS